MKTKTILVTGGCGFIGSHFIRHWLKKHSDFRVVNLDKLTYSGNPAWVGAVRKKTGFVNAHIDLWKSHKL